MSRDIKILPKRWYVLYTNEEVVIRGVETLVEPTLTKYIKHIADIEFVNDNPCEKALRFCGASRTVDYTELSYTGHPTANREVWKAVVDVKLCLCSVPYGTKAAEVLFGKK